MQIHYLPRNIYKLACYSLRQENLSEQAKRLKKWLGAWDVLKRNKLPDAEIAKITGISRATYYRRKKAIQIYGSIAFENKSKAPNKKRQSKIPESTIQTVLSIRQENPTYGKAKIAVILRRDHNIKLSESSVGRILKKLFDQNKIQRSPSATRIKKRPFNIVVQHPWLQKIPRMAFYMLAHFWVWS